MKHRAKFSVARTHGHHLAQIVLRDDPSIEEQVRAAVTCDIEIDVTTRSERAGARPGVNPKTFDVVVRRRLADAGWGIEAAVSDGVILDNEAERAPTRGFDLARYDALANVARLWSLCFGRRPLADGPLRWTTEVNKRSWVGVAEELVARYAPVEGQDLAVPQSQRTILGEIQAGNWALVYRDFLKLLDAMTQLEVDLFVYIVPDRGYLSHLSSGIVSFEGSHDVVTLFSGLLRVPVWIVGVDMELVPNPSP